MFLFVEAFLFLGWARFLMLFPFSKVAPTLGTYMQETVNLSSEANRAALSEVCDAIRIMSQHTFWQSKCLVKAIAAMKMLERRRIESTLYLGTARDHAGQMAAHAWLRSGSSFITGFEEMSRFTVVGKFAKTIQN